MDVIVVVQARLLGLDLTERTMSDDGAGHASRWSMLGQAASVDGGALRRCTNLKSGARMAQTRLSGGFDAGRCNGLRWTSRSDQSQPGKRASSSHTIHAYRARGQSGPRLAVPVRSQGWPLPGPARPLRKTV